MTWNHLKSSKTIYLKQAMKQLASPETSQEITNILWNEPYQWIFFKNLKHIMVEHSLQNKEIQLTECTCSKS